MEMVVCSRYHDAVAYPITRKQGGIPPFRLEPTEVRHVSTYDFKITLKDEDPPEPLTRSYTFFFVVANVLQDLRGHDHKHNETE